MKEKQNNLLIVLVLYNQFLEDSETFKSLINVVKDSLDFKYKIVVYDNSLIVRDNLLFLEQFEAYFEIDYVSDSTNPGISHAYNYAFKIAQKSKVSWLLLLDQDTKLPLNYIRTFLDTVDYSNTSIVGYVPRIFGELNGSLISPFKINSFGLMRNISKDINGLIDYGVIAINSGTFISVDFISDINGFSEDYPLDMLDFWLFTEIFINKKKVCLLDINIEHNLSISDFENNVSLHRYESIILAEKRFFSQKILWKFMFKARLLRRLLVQSKFKDKTFFKKTLKYILQ
ncbi:glycosyltransferase [Yeosuana marina]|uniref:glycosyltransferase n=1 Tax=Yeosuana marina TaxID=1565536 RepID=UPI0030EC9063